MKIFNLILLNWWIIIIIRQIYIFFIKKFDYWFPSLNWLNFKTFLFKFTFLLKYYSRIIILIRWWLIIIYYLFRCRLLYNFIIFIYFHKLCLWVALKFFFPRIQFFMFIYILISARFDIYLNWFKVAYMKIYLGSWFLYWR